MRRHGGTLTDSSAERTDDLGEGLEAKLVNLLLGRKHKRGRSIVQVGRIRSRDRPILLEDGLEARNLLRLDLLVLLVLLDDNLTRAALERHGRDLGLECAGLPCLGGLAVRIEAVVVLVLAGDLVLCGGLLGAARASSQWVQETRVQDGCSVTSCPWGSRRRRQSSRP